jgi:hypothetical protein
MEHSIQRAIAYELHYLFNENSQTGWEFTLETDKFIATPPAIMTAQSEFPQLLEAFVFDICAFISYRRYVSIERRLDGGYTVTSSLRSGDGYQIDFEPRHRHLTNPYKFERITSG